MSQESTSGTKTIPRIDYTRLITLVMYEGGAEAIMEELYRRGINEAFFYSARGKPIGRSSAAGGLPEIPKTEILHAVVAADQADYIYSLIYHDFKLNEPGVGMISVNKLVRSSRLELPQGIPFVSTLG
jgi:hypothetical protein